VSVASASRALNGHVNVTATTRARVVAAAERLHYVPHHGARSLTMAQTDTIGVVLPDLFGGFFSELIRGINRGAQAAGLQLLLSTFHGDATRTAGAVRSMRGRVDGLLVMLPVVHPVPPELGLASHLPTVVMNAGPGDGAYASIAIDNAGGARTMVAHLVDSGRRCIAMLGGPEGNADALGREAGFRDAVRTLLGDASPLILPGDFTEESGQAAAAAILADRRGIDAVFAANDMMAVGCLTTLSAAGVRVPEEIAVAGFDDVPVARYVTPALTTMRVNIADMGTRALETLAGLIAARGLRTASSQTIEPELVVRASSAPRTPRG